MKVTLTRDGTEIAARELTKAEMACLAHDLPGEAGFVRWLNDLIDGKIAASKARMSGAALEALRTGRLSKDAISDFVPETLIEALTKDPGYKNRLQRDAEGSLATGAERPVRPQRS